MVVQVHGHVDGEAEELGPGARAPVVQELRLHLQHGGEEIAVPVLVLRTGSIGDERRSQKTAV